MSNWLTVWSTITGGSNATTTGGVGTCQGAVVTGTGLGGAALPEGYAFTLTRDDTLAATQQNIVELAGVQGWR